MILPVYGSCKTPVVTSQLAAFVTLVRSRARTMLRGSQPTLLMSSQAGPKSATRSYPVNGAFPLTGIEARTVIADSVALVASGAAVGTVVGAGGGLTWVTGLLAEVDGSVHPVSTKASIAEAATIGARTVKFRMRSS